MKAAMIVLAKVVILAVFSKYLGIAVPFIVAILYLLQRFYLQTSRQVRLLSIEAKAPLYSFLNECVAGVATISAFGWQSQYQNQSYVLIDQAQQPQYMLSCIQFCLGFTLQFLVAVITVALVTIAVMLTDEFTPGCVGVSLVTVVSFSEVLVRLIESWTRLETSVGAVSRVKHFVAKTGVKEARSTTAALPPMWPSVGAVQISNLTASYKFAFSQKPVL
jgi:ABC-type bacteriocin/lantibiotic exporter with double-glycine peptidase domain